MVSVRAERSVVCSVMKKMEVNSSALSMYCIMSIVDYQQITQS